MSQLLADIEALVTPILEQEQLELVDLTYQRERNGWTLCFFLDKPGGFNLSDCETWSDRLGNSIDSSGLIEMAYVLEVSSPGINRALKKLKDFQTYAGQRVEVRLFSPLNGQKNFHGTLLGADEQDIRIKLEDQDHREVALPRSQVAKCRLDPIIEV